MIRSYIAAMHGSSNRSPFAIALVGLCVSACGTVDSSRDARTPTDGSSSADRVVLDVADVPIDSSVTTDASTDTGRANDVSDVDGGIDASVVRDGGADAAADVRSDVPRSDGSVTGSAGCGHTVATGVTHPTIRVGTLDRTYVLSIPSGYDRNRAVPLVFGWHGRRGSGTNFRGGGTSYGGGVERSSAGAAIFVYPDGLPVTSDPGDTGWVDTDPGVGRDFDFFDAMLTSLSDTLCIDRTHVFSYGHSFGAFMTEALGCHRATVLRGIGPVAGGPPYRSSTCPGTPVPAWIDNAQDDPTVDFTTRGIPARDYWVRTNGCSMTTMPVAPTPCVAYQGCTQPVHWCAPATGGHAFPSLAYGGIWNFFAAL